MSMHFIKRSVLIILISLISFVKYAQPQQNRIKIAVMDFINSSDRSNQDYLKTTISENIITRFAGSSGIIVVERSRLMEMLNEIKLGQSGVVDENTAAKIGNALGADGIIIGSYTIFDDKLRINARLIDVQTIQVKYAKQLTGTLIMPLIDELTELLLIELTPDKMERAKLLNERINRSSQIATQLKNPTIAAIGGFVLPILGHAYIGKTSNIIRGTIYTVVGPGGIIMAFAWGGLSDDNLVPFFIGVGACLISGIDAGISAGNYNKKLRNKGITLNVNPNFSTRHYLFSINYHF